MEPIWQAVQRAKAGATGRATISPGRRFASISRQACDRCRHRTSHASGWTQADLDRTHLQADRIVAHDPTDPRSKAFDILRTQVLQTMDREKWQIVAATSPAAACGKTLAAVNLALSIARQPERSVFLVDLDLQKPSLASSLGAELQAWGGWGIGRTNRVGGRHHRSANWEQSIDGAAGRNSGSGFVRIDSLSRHAHDVAKYQTGVPLAYGHRRFAADAGKRRRSCDPTPGRLCSAGRSSRFLHRVRNHAMP